MTGVHDDTRAIARERFQTYECLFGDVMLQVLGRPETTLSHAYDIAKTVVAITDELHAALESRSFDFLTSHRPTTIKTDEPPKV